MLTFSDSTLEPLARRLRWFGINREDKQKGVWENDIKEVGYKYQLTDIGAALGLAGLEEIHSTLAHRRKLYDHYVDRLSNCEGLRIVDDFNPRKQHAAWLFSVLADRRRDLQLKLRERGIESGQTHYRNDRYSVFACSESFPNMDLVDDKYLILPLHTKIGISEVDRICDVIREGW